MTTDLAASRSNMARLRELRLSHADEVEIFCSHGSGELKALQADA